MTCPRPNCNIVFPHEHKDAVPLVYDDYETKLRLVHVQCRSPERCAVCRLLGEVETLREQIRFHQCQVIDSPPKENP